MNKKNFEIWMNSIDKTYLEEAATPPAKKHSYRSFILATAACLALTATGMLLRQSFLPDAATPDSYEPDKYQLVTEQFTKYDELQKEDIQYTVLSHIVAEPTDISGVEASPDTPLVWVADGLEIQLCSTNDTAWASWYDTRQNTQWCIKANTSTRTLLTTAMDIVRELGYNVAVAPENSTNITYNAFSHLDLTVAETTFLLNETQYSYRIAATYEIAEDFADISGTGELYACHSVAEVGWCPARIYYDENGYGKIIWFDIVPGLLYSLSMETNASEEALLSLAHELFVPAQDTADW